MINSTLFIDNNYVIQSLPDFVREDREMSLPEKKKLKLTVFVKAGLTPGAQKNGAHSLPEGRLEQRGRRAQ